MKTTAVQEQDIEEQLDTGWICLVEAAHMLRAQVDEQKIRRQLGLQSGDYMDRDQLVKAAKRLALHVRLLTPHRDELETLAKPGIVRFKAGNYVVVGRVNAFHVILFDPHQPRPVAMPLHTFLQLWDGEFIELTPRFTWKRLGQDFSIQWFMPVFMRYKQFFGDVLIASFFLQLAGLGVPLFTQVIVDKVLVNNGMSTLDILALVLLIVAVFETVMGILRTYISLHSTNKIDVILGSRLLRHVMALPLRYFEMRRVGDTLARIRELDNIRNFLTGSSLTAGLDTLFAVVFIAVMFVYSPKLSVIGLILLPPFIILTLMTTPKLRRQFEHLFRTGADTQAYMVESITGIQTIKSLALEPQFNHKWEQRLSAYVKTSFDSVTLSNVITNISNFIQAVSAMVVLWFGARLVMDGQLTVGQLIAFQMLYGMVSAPVMRLAGMWQNFQQTKLAVERMGDILHTSPELVAKPTQQPPAALRGEIEFKQVCFRYRIDGSQVLDHVSFHISPGQRVGVVGRSGSGKSTLMKLLQRLYLPESGVITIDGHDVTQWDPMALRRQIGVVLQENYLFSGSVRENIALSRPDAPMQDVIRVAQMAGAHEFVLELPEGYDTQVGERGTSLSGGQKQRIAIARALLTNPRLLIFDEATSALDYESERVIKQNMKGIADGRTLMMIAHRLSTIRDCDTIIVLDHGQVVEQGSHDELLRQQGLYAFLCSQQAD